MPAPTNPSSYPASFALLADELTLETDLTLTFANKKHAERMRFKFYSFKKAIKTTLFRNKFGEHEEEVWKERLRKLTNSALVVKEDKSTGEGKLIFTIPDNLSTYDAFNEALQNMTRTETVAEQLAGGRLGAPKQIPFSLGVDSGIGEGFPPTEISTEELATETSALKEVQESRKTQLNEQPQSADEPLDVYEMLNRQGREEEFKDEK